MMAERELRLVKGDSFFEGFLVRSYDSSEMSVHFSDFVERPADVLSGAVRQQSHCSKERAIVGITDNKQAYLLMRKLHFKLYRCFSKYLQTHHIPIPREIVFHCGRGSQEQLSISCFAAIMDFYSFLGDYVIH